MFLDVAVLLYWTLVARRSGGASQHSTFMSHHSCLNTHVSIFMSQHSCLPPSFHLVVVMRAVIVKDYAAPRGVDVVAVSPQSRHLGKFFTVEDLRSTVTSAQHLLSISTFFGFCFAKKCFSVQAKKKYQILFLFFRLYFLFFSSSPPQGNTGTQTGCNEIAPDFTFL